jgi:hypothetical protein
MRGQPMPAFEREWNWNDWIVDQQSVRLVARGNPGQSLDFNHVVVGLHAMETD